jgi:hypothetical protein
MIPELRDEGRLDQMVSDGISSRIASRTIFDSPNASSSSNIHDSFGGFLDLWAEPELPMKSE